MILGNDNRVFLTGGESIRVENLEISGQKPRTAGKIGKNATVLFNSGDLKIFNSDATGVTCYNLVEQVYSKDGIKLKSVEISGLKSGNKISHNVLSFYNLADGAEIIIKDCNFDLAPGSNVIRFDNLSEARGVKVRFLGCSWTYENSKYTESDLEWSTLVLLQPGKTDQQGKPTMGRDNGWEISLKDCSYNGKKVWRANETADLNTLENHIGVVSIYDPGVAESFPYSSNQGFIPKISVI